MEAETPKYLKHELSNRIQKGAGATLTLDEPTHVLFGGVYFAKLSDLAIAPMIRDRHGVAQLRNIDSYKSFAILGHGSSSLREARLVT